MTPQYRNLTVLFSSRQGYVAVFDGQGQQLEAETFISFLHPQPQASTSSAQSDPPAPIGASLRWAVAIDEEHRQPRLELQGMPVDARHLNKKYYSSDNAVSILLGSYQLNADIFADSFAGGLVPQFFSASRSRALEFLTKNQVAAKDIVTNINSRLLIMEHMSLEAAINHLKAKKSRTAKGVSAFPIPPKKRGRPAAQDTTESGMDHTIPQITPNTFMYQTYHYLPYLSNPTVAQYGTYTGQ